jgi:hypothetical protein
MATSRFVTMDRWRSLPSATKSLLCFSKSVYWVDGVTPFQVSINLLGRTSRQIKRTEVDAMTLIEAIVAIEVSYENAHAQTKSIIVETLCGGILSVTE